MKDLTVSELVLHCDREIDPSEIPMVRGAVMRLRLEDDRFHNHLDEPEISESGKRNYNLYRYPVVQYRAEGKKIRIIGVGDVGEEIEKMGAMTRILLNTSRWPVNSPDDEPTEVNVLRSSFEQRPAEIGIKNNGETYVYQFDTPWYALNQQNYHEWQRITSWQARLKLLRRILKGHLASIVGYLDPDIHIELDEWFKGVLLAINVRRKPIQFKGFTMLGFVGRFEANIVLPTGLGIGKAPALGFGVVKRLPDANPVTNNVF